MRISVRTGLSAIVLACVFLSAGTVHFAWRRVADANSRALAATLSGQISDRVREELSARIGEAEAAYSAVRTLLVQNVIDSHEADRREFVFLSQIQAQPTLSWVAFGWPDGAFFGSHKLGDMGLEMIETSPRDGGFQRRTDRYRLYPDDIEFQQRRFTATDYDVRRQPWFTESEAAEGPTWSFVSTHPDMKRGAIAFAGPIDVYGHRQGVLAVMIELNRLSRFLGHLAVGRAGAAFILSGDGSIVAGPDPTADELKTADFSSDPLLPLARAIGARLSGPPEPGRMQLEQAGSIYDVDLAPLGFRDWRVAVAVPESEILGPVHAATMRLGGALAAFVLLTATASMLLAGRIIARPLRALAGDLAQVETFDLAALRYRRSRLTELDALSASLMRMANGLAAFGKYIPRDLVRDLVAAGVEPRPGGETRPLTLMFVDVAGFTGLSERLGPDVVPLISRFLEVSAQAVEEHGGTVDKFIGDAVMAFWGAPRPDPQHALNACRGALACVAKVREAGLTDDLGAPLRIRIGLHSGPAVVGNVGSHLRLSYTALGDTVNLASRIEGINKVFGTSILIGHETRVQAGERIAVRELDTIAVYGRAGGTALFELLGLAEPRAVRAEWVAAYETGLGLYRDRRWQDALTWFARADRLRGGDQPSRLMMMRCESLFANPPNQRWQAVYMLESK